MKRLRQILAAVALGAFAAWGQAAAQDANSDTLADVRLQLFSLYGSLEALRLELHQSGTSPAASLESSSDTAAMQRIDDLEFELRRAISKIEELEYRIVRIAEDGMRQIKDLEFRLVELGGGDLASIEDGVLLGGESEGPAQGLPPDVDSFSESTPSADERSSFDLAMEAFQRGDHARAAELFDAFSQEFSLSALNVDAHYFRAESLMVLSDPTNAARAYLESYRLDETGATAPRALVGLGSSFTDLNRTAEACRLYQEILVAFPQSPESIAASFEIEQLGCN